MTPGRKPAAAALEPFRATLLAELREPASAATLAGELDVPRQRINYHLRLLEKHGLVEVAGTRTWGGLTEHQPTSPNENKRSGRPGSSKDALMKSLSQLTMLGRTATFDDVGSVAAFAASDRAASITGSELNITCGAIVG